MKERIEEGINQENKNDTEIRVDCKELQQLGISCSGIRLQFG